MSQQTRTDWNKPEQPGATWKDPETSSKSQRKDKPSPLWAPMAMIDIQWLRKASI